MLHYLYLIVLIFIIGSFKSQLLSKDNFKVSIIDNPAPGYIKLDRVAYLIDNYGKPVFSDRMNFGTNSFKLLKNGMWVQLEIDHYILLDSALNIIDSISNPTDYLLDPHDIIGLSNGNYLILTQEVVTMDLSKVVEGGNNKANIISNVLLEVDTKGNIYWQWRAFDHTQITDLVDDLPLTQYSIDFTHINSMDEDPDGNILISIRHFDEVALIHKSSGKFLWRLGGSKSKNNNFTFINDTVDSFFGFSHQHSAKYLSNGNILIYDNGNLKPNKYSRAVEYSLDLTNKIAKKVWEYRHSPDIYNGNMGSVQRLRNGNTLINYSNGKVLEIKPDKTIAFEINSLYDDNFIYLAQKTIRNSTFSKEFINKDGSYNFYNTPINTGIRLEMNEVSDSTSVYVQLHHYSPPTGEYSDSVFTEILPYRWVITSDKKISFKGSINISLSILKDLPNPKKVKLFYRNAEAKGIFNELDTYLDTAKNELFANITGFGEFAIANSGLIKPNHIKPFDNSGSDLSGSIIWGKSVGASKYRLQVSESPDFLNTNIDTLIINSTVYHYQNLLQDNNYYWRVKAINKTDSSQWSNVSSFITADLSNTVSLTYPENELIITDSKCKFEWDDRANTNHYTFQISDSKFFNKILHQEDNLDRNNFEFAGLKPDTTYYWRVGIVKNDTVSNWSIPWSFITTSSELLKKVNLVYPESNSSSVDVSGQLIWQKIEGAKYYQVTISTKSDFSTIILSKSFVDDTILKYSNLEYDTQYFWRVCAFNDSSRSYWSDTKAFYSELKSPQIIFPLNHNENIDLIGFIRWEMENDYYPYHLQVSKDVEFNDLVIDSVDILDKRFNYSLESNSIYYCRIRTYHNNNYSKWSSIIKFTTEDLTSIIDSSYFNNLEIYPNPANDILNIKPKFSNNQTEAKIFDILGNNLLSMSLNGIDYVYKFDISKLNPGIYIIQINKQRALIIKQ